jgi:hypothetical protein
LYALSVSMVIVIWTVYALGVSMKIVIWTLDSLSDPEQSSWWAQVLRPKNCKTLFGSVILFRIIHMKIDTRIWFGPVNSYVFIENCHGDSHLNFVCFKYPWWRSSELKMV